METIIEEQEKEFKERFTPDWWVSLKKEDIKRLGLVKIFKYHKKYMRQILQALVEREEKSKEPCANTHLFKNGCEYCENCTITSKNRLRSYNMKTKYEKEYKQRLKKFAAMSKLLKKGYTQKQIASKYGVTRQAISHFLIQAGEDGSGIKLRQLKPHNKYTYFLKGRDRTRMMVRIRDNFTCQDCGNRRTPEEAKKQKKYLFDVHHLEGLCGKKSRGYDKQSDMDILVTLCHKCHYQRPEHKVNSLDFKGRKKLLTV